MVKLTNCSPLQTIILIYKLLIEFSGRCLFREFEPTRKFFPPVQQSQLYNRFISLLGLVDI